MPKETYVHDQAQIKVFDKDKNKFRIFDFTVHNHWGFIGNSRGDTITEMQITGKYNNKLPLSRLKQIFNGDEYVASHDDKPKMEYIDDENRSHRWIENNGKYIHNYLHMVRDPELAKRYDLEDVLENGKSIIPQPTGNYHFDKTPEVGEPVHIVNDDTKEVSGDITPTTKKALTNLKDGVNKGTLDLKVSPDSQLTFASGLPSGEIINGSSLDLALTTTADRVKLDNSHMAVKRGTIKDSTFTNVETTMQATYKPLNVNKSNLSNVNLLDGSTIHDSIVDYAALNRTYVTDSSLKGGVYVKGEIVDSYTWTGLQSVVDDSNLSHTRLENRHTNTDYYEEHKGELPKTVDDIYEQSATDTYGQGKQSPMMISNSSLTNVEILRDGDIGSTISDTYMENAIVKDWIIADKSSIQCMPSKPLLVGKVYAKDNKLNFRTSAVSLNLDEYSSANAQNGLELPEGKDFNDTNIAKNADAVVMNPNSKEYKQLAKLDHSHYILNNGDEAFDNLSNVLGDDGGKHLAAPAVKQSQVSGPEV